MSNTLELASFVQQSHAEGDLASNLMKIALLQLNPTVGNIRGNARMLEQAARKAQAAGARLGVASELVLSGYPPKDLLLRDGFVAACDRSLDQLAQALPSGFGLLVGHPTYRGVPDGLVANAASLLTAGRVVSTVHKRLLPNYDVFDERRYFWPGTRSAPLEFESVRLGVHICEDAWFDVPHTGTAYRHEVPATSDPVADLARAGAQILINLSASPFELRKRDRRFEIVRGHAQRHGLPFVFVNQVGGNDDLVFDGSSFAVDASGCRQCRSAAFAEDVSLHALSDLQQHASGSDPLPADPSRESELLDALVLGLRDYMGKCGFDDCVLGLSGGIDSALACYIAVCAVGAEHVHAMLMPSRHSSDHSVRDAQRLADNLGIDHQVLEIDPVHQAFEQTRVVGQDLADEPDGLAAQNLQARIRGALVMVRSNRHGWLALATGNKSELAIGYCTLYGDMAGGFAVLCDVLKRDVYAVSRYINQQRECRGGIPE
ncbi:MAG: NAD+ synthase, partial [Planctomycetaceae bacterium]